MASPSTTFTCFVRLPAELQFKIFKLALEFEVSQPKNIYIEVTSASDATRPNHSRLEFKLHTPVPSLLHTSHVTRYKALKVYKSVFDFKHKNKAGRTIEEGAIYINPDVDTLIVKFSPSADAITAILLAKPHSPPVPQPAFGNTRWSMAKYEWSYCRPPSELNAPFPPGCCALWVFSPATVRAQVGIGFTWPTHLQALVRQIAPLHVDRIDVVNSSMWCNEGLFLSWPWDLFWGGMRSASFEDGEVDAARGMQRAWFF